MGPDPSDNERDALGARFLRMNGHPLRPEPLASVRMIENLASGNVTEKDFAEWLRTLEAPDPR
jgi:prophage maintenance system killer protein